MQVEIGKIYEGTVKNITNYGIFVDIHNPENEKIMGMVHISEISKTYVNEIRDFVKEGENVKVKVIGINEAGKISLSMKQVENSEVTPKSTQKSQQTQQQNNNRPKQQSQKRDKPHVWEPKKKPPMTELSFEDMLSRFKQNSEERICDIKRNTERKNRSRRK